VRYRKLFKAKVAINAAMAIICFLYMIVVYATPADVTLSSWINQCNHQNFALMYLF
jgi:hypothetical protein